LARKKEAKRKGMDAYKILVNEDEGRFWKTERRKISTDYLKLKCANAGYKMNVPGQLPNDILLLLAGIDVQDNGFYFVVNGYGRGMHKYMVHCGFILSPKGESTDPASGGSIDPRQLAYERLINGVLAHQFLRKDGRKLELQDAFIDRGGHRPDDVDYITEKFPKIRAYIGSPKVDYAKKMIEESKTGPHFMGQSLRLTDEMGKIIGSDKYHLPDDVPDDFTEQVLNEYFEEPPLKFGGRRRVLVKKEPNHYRSAENMCLACAYLNNLQELLFDDSSVEEMRQRVQAESEPGAEKTGDDKNKDRIKSEYLDGLGW